MDKNQAQLTGYVSYIQAPNGNGPYKFKLDTVGGGKDKETGNYRKNYVPVKAWRRENLDPTTLTEGDEVRIIGRIVAEGYVKKDGTKATDVHLLAETVDVLRKGNRQQHSRPPTAQPANSYDGFGRGDAYEEDIPF